MTVCDYLLIFLFSAKTLRYESAKVALDEMKRVVDIAEKRFRKMKNRVTSFKTSQQQYEIEMKKRDKIEKQMQARIQGLTKELETEREKTEDALLEEMQRVDDEIRRRNEEWNAQNETQRRNQEALLSRKIFCSLINDPHLSHLHKNAITSSGTQRDLEDARQRCETAEKKYTKASFAIAELATVASRVEMDDIENNDKMDEFELNFCHTRRALELCVNMQSQLQRLKSRHVHNMEKSQKQEKLQTATQSSLRKQLNETMQNLDILKENTKKKSSELMCQKES